MCAVDRDDSGVKADAEANAEAEAEAVAEDNPDPEVADVVGDEPISGGDDVADISNLTSLPDWWLTGTGAATAAGEMTAGGLTAAAAGAAAAAVTPPPPDAVESTDVTEDPGVLLA